MSLRTTAFELETVPHVTGLDGATFPCQPKKRQDKKKRKKV